MHHTPSWRRGLVTTRLRTQNTRLTSTASSWRQVEKRTSCHAKKECSSVSHGQRRYDAAARTHHTDDDADRLQRLACFTAEPVPVPKAASTTTAPLAAARASAPAPARLAHQVVLLHLRQDVLFAHECVPQCFFCGLLLAVAAEGKAPPSTTRSTMPERAPPSTGSVRFAGGRRVQPSRRRGGCRRAHGTRSGVSGSDAHGRSLAACNSHDSRRGSAARGNATGK